MLNFFSHVGIVVHDLDIAIERWTGLYGLTLVERFDVPEEGVRSAMLSTGGPFGEQTCIELLSPTDVGNLDWPVARRLAAHGEGVYHLAFVTSGHLDSTVKEMRRHQVRVLDTAPSGNAERAIVHPASANGVLLELLGQVPRGSAGETP